MFDQYGIPASERQEFFKQWTAAPGASGAAPIGASGSLERLNSIMTNSIFSNSAFSKGLKEFVDTTYRAAKNEGQISLKPDASINEIATYFKDQADAWPTSLAYDGIKFFDHTTFHAKDLTFSDPVKWNGYKTGTDTKAPFDAAIKAIKARHGLIDPKWTDDAVIQFYSDELLAQLLSTKVTGAPAAIHLGLPTPNGVDIPANSTFEDCYKALFGCNSTDRAQNKGVYVAALKDRASRDASITTAIMGTSGPQTVVFDSIGTTGLSREGSTANFKYKVGADDKTAVLAPKGILTIPEPTALVTIADAAKIDGVNTIVVGGDTYILSPDNKYVKATITGDSATVGADTYTCDASSGVWAKQSPVATYADIGTTGLSREGSTANFKYKVGADDKTAVLAPKGILTIPEPTALVIIADAAKIDGVNTIVVGSDTYILSPDNKYVKATITGDSATVGADTYTRDASSGVWAKQKATVVYPTGLTADNCTVNDNGTFTLKAAMGTYPAGIILKAEGASLVQVGGPATTTFNGNITSPIKIVSFPTTDDATPKKGTKLNPNNWFALYDDNGNAFSATIIPKGIAGSRKTNSIQWIATSVSLASPNKTRTLSGVTYAYVDIVLDDGRKMRGWAKISNDGGKDGGLVLS
jgi:hypothetical protein